MKHVFLHLLLLLLFYSGYSQTKIIDKETNYPVSYATVSFGNGQGLFADDDGMFIFTKKRYPDVDSLYISALGYKDLVLATTNLPKTITMQVEADKLDEVIVTAKVDRKFKKETIKPYLDDDYYKCWLPTIESEIAVFFPNEDAQLKKITAVRFPITLESKDWKKRKRANADKRKFSTLFKVKFYKNNDGLPGEVMTYTTITFRVTEKNGDEFELDVSEHDLFIPENGFFVSIQVLGYTDQNGKLLPNKKYKEIKGKNGVVKIPTNFRPLLPFTDEISAHNTYIKRVFISGNNWVQFKKGNGIESSLLRTNLNNYGVGINYNAYKDE
ncbi:carboxypeptidase-like regulatory domain-containing protein [Psychroserpens sp. SPM9]|uniref:carboxypeptidase-like regulatory domain-containing protein n=1 Tax=Psychroserpens sp. SPM9 TaxID=2975598 RepID=UPI0021A7C583|nr:carboxypeptidase-like regulatory domain-containing protein [Psychroserpens sp. SPM9]MDG5492081.1 carboxypeptidase-like regulatory domain-containing protein [Psychroserpens sp. SPM9]